MRLRQSISDELHVFLVTLGVLLFQVSVLTVLMVLAYNYHWRVTPWISAPIAVLWLFALKLNMEAAVTLGSEWLKSYHQSRKQQMQTRIMAEGNVPDILAERVKVALWEAREYERTNPARESAWKQHHAKVGALLDEYIKSLASHKPPGEWNSELDNLLKSNGLPPWIHDGEEYLTFVENPNAPRER